MPPDFLTAFYQTTSFRAPFLKSPYLSLFLCSLCQLTCKRVQVDQTGFCDHSPCRHSPQCVQGHAKEHFICALQLPQSSELKAWFTLEVEVPRNTAKHRALQFAAHVNQCSEWARGLCHSFPWNRKLCEAPTHFAHSCVHLKTSFRMISLTGISRIKHRCILINSSIDEDRSQLAHKTEQTPKLGIDGASCAPVHI